MRFSFRDDDVDFEEVINSEERLSNTSTFLETRHGVDLRQRDGLSDPRKLGEIYRPLTVQDCVTSDRRVSRDRAGLRSAVITYAVTATMYRNIAHVRAIHPS